MGDCSPGEGTSGVRNLKFLIQDTKDKFAQSNKNDNRWPCPFCIAITETKIKCRIHIKRDHPSIYNMNEEELSQLSQMEEGNSNDVSGPKDLKEFLRLVEEDISQNSNENSQDEDDGSNLKKCSHCPPKLSHKTYKGFRGLKIHHFKMHKDVEFTCFDNQSSTVDVSINQIEDRLGLLNTNTKIIKRIPKGARMSAGYELAKLIDECVSKNDLTSWQNLLFFAYGAFQTPKRKSKSESLTRILKRNIKNYNINKIDPNMEMKNRKNLPLNKRVEAKISDGDIRGATKLLLSSDSLASQDYKTFMLLKEKHPSPTRPLNIPDKPNNAASHFQPSEDDVLKSISSFYNGSSGGIDGIRPQHLKDLISGTNGEAGFKLLKSITLLTNLMFSGKVLSSICRIIYGARLCALTKKDGGIRPIAIGSTFRRITAKIACDGVREEIGSYLRPKQVGVNTKGGCEAAVHVCRSFIRRNKKSKKIILKIDFRNAFNCVERDVLLRTIQEKAPSIYAFMWQCYSLPSALFFGNEQIPSEVGAQQGDPCGPMAFSLSIHPIIEMLASELNIWYLDDGTLGGEYDAVLSDFKLLIQECGKIGLEINPTKCELFFCGNTDQSIIDQFNAVSPGIKVVDTHDLELLGAPLTEEAEEKVLLKMHSKLKTMFERIGTLNHHMAYYLLKNCFSIPKLTYLLRSTGYFKHKHLLHAIDEDIKATLETICNSSFKCDKYEIISLPARCGGLGIRKSTEICLPSFISSVHSVINLVTLIDPYLSDETMIADYTLAMEDWFANFNSIPDDMSNQRSWDNIGISEKLSNLTFNSEKEKARYLSSTMAESNFWLAALPSKHLGTLLDNNTFRISIALRFGLEICSSHKCVCGDPVFKDGLHGLSCSKSAGRIPCHSELNNIIHMSLKSSNIPAMREPPGMFRDDGKRVDGVTLIPWSKGQHLVWDATCSDTMAPSYLHLSSSGPGKVAMKAANVKINKYKKLLEQNYIILPFAVETLGPWCAEAIHFIDILGNLIKERTNEPRAKMYLKQRIGMAIQRTNAARVMGTYGDDHKGLDEVFYILQTFSE